MNSPLADLSSDMSNVALEFGTVNQLKRALRRCLAHANPLHWPASIGFHEFQKKSPVAGFVVHFDQYFFHSGIEKYARFETARRCHAETAVRMDQLLIDPHFAPVI